MIAAALALFVAPALAAPPADPVAWVREFYTPFNVDNKLTPELAKKLTPTLRARLDAHLKHCQAPTDDVPEECDYEPLNCSQDTVPPKPKLVSRSRSTARVLIYAPDTLAEARLVTGPGGWLLNDVQCCAPEPGKTTLRCHSSTDNAVRPAPTNGPSPKP